MLFIISCRWHRGYRWRVCLHLFVYM